MTPPRREVATMSAAALLGAPALTGSVVVGVWSLEGFGDRVASLGPLTDRPSLVRALLISVAVVALAGAAVWGRRTAVGQRAARAWAARSPTVLPDARPGVERWPRAGTAAMAIGAVAIAVAIVQWPNLFRLSSHFIGLGDSEQHIGLAQLIHEEMSFTNPIPGRLSGIVHPDGLDSLLLDGYGPLWVTAILGFFMGPVLAYNLTLVFTTAANAGAGWLLASRFTNHRGLLALCGVALASAPNVAVRAHAGHMNLTWLFTVALVAAAATKDGRQAPNPLRLGALLALAYLGSGYFLVVGGLIAAGIYAANRPTSWRATTGRFLAAGLLAALLLSPWLISRAQFTADEADGPAAAAVDDALRTARRSFVADTTSLLIAVPNERFGTVPFSDTRRDRLEVTVEGWSNPGWLLLLALGAVLIVPGPTRLAVGSGTVLLYVLALGPVPRVFAERYLIGNTDMGWAPYSFFDVAPILSGLRVPGRFSMGIAVLAVMALAAAGEFLRRRVKTRTFIATGVALLALVVVTNPRDVGTFEDMAAASDTAALQTIDAHRQPDDAALVVPNDCLGGEVRYAMLAVHTDVPLVGCHAPHLTLPLVSGLEHYLDDSMSSLRCAPEVFAFLPQQDNAGDNISNRQVLDGLANDLGIRFLLVHLEPLQTPQCTAVRARIEQMLGEGDVNAVGTPGRFLILELTGTVNS